MALGLWIAYIVSVLLALLLRNKVYALFLGVLLGVQTWVWTQILPVSLGWIVLIPVVQVHLHFLSLIRPRLRPLWWRVLLSWPALWFVAGTVLASPWALASALGYPLPGAWFGFLVAGIGFVQSIHHRPEEVGIGLHKTTGFQRVKTQTPQEIDGLRIGHLTDFHLGPFVSASRARAAVERIVAKNPDLVLLTGDFMTMESQQDKVALRYALEPLLAMEGRVFACRGNHDLEAPETVAEVCEELKIELLIDEARQVTTRLGTMEIVGVDFRFRHVNRKIVELFEELGEPVLPRIVLLHDPLHFRFLPDSSADLVLSGHTHGGQLGLVSLGIPLTVVGLTGVVPDQGLFSRGQMRLYVNRGLGHYGFPLRVGVPAEESVLHVDFRGVDGAN